MKLKKFKERDNKRIGIIVFTIACILLVSGVILYRTFAIFEVKTNQNVINGQVQSMGDLEFAFYKEVDGKDTIVKEVPKKDEGYSLDTSSSYCKDLLNDKQVSTVNWDYENWEVRLKNVTTTKTKCYLHFKKVYKDTVLNGADPDLMNGRLVPVKILDNEKPSDVTEYTNVSKTYGGKVIKADITENWYSYANNQWANAVILKDGKADDYTPGQEILESDIESYFVWIPRYRYKIWFDETESLKFIPLENVNSYTQIPNYGQANAVEIIFENKESENMTNNVKDKYLTHPAFVAFDINGFWVGKFETGFKGANSKDEAQNKNVTDTTDISKIVIKPNVYSWRNIDASNAFYTSYYYQRELESHMAKNSEWGAVVYLANSKYGRCTETDCNEVTLNNNTSFVTGYSANKVELSIYKENGIKEEVPINQDGQYGCSYYSHVYFKM